MWAIIVLPVKNSSSLCWTFDSGLRVFFFYNKAAQTTSNQDHQWRTRRPKDPQDYWWPRVDSNPATGLHKKAQGIKAGWDHHRSKVTPTKPLPTRENPSPRPERPGNEFNLTWRPTRPDIMPSIPARLMGKPSPKGEQSTLTLSMAMLFFLIGKQMGKHSHSLAVAMMKLLFRLLIDYLGGSTVSYFLKI